MSRRRLRTATIRTLAAAVGLGLAVGISGCASAGVSQQRWASALEQLDGVTAADWSRQAWSSMSATAYPGVLTVSPDLTEAQARAIAAESCRHDAAVTSVEVGIDDPRLGANIVRQIEISPTACIPEEALVNFSRVSAAMQELRPRYAGEFFVFGPDDSPGPLPRHDADGTLIPPPEPNPFDREMGVTATAAEDGMLLDAIWELHAQLGDTPFTFTGKTGEDGDSLAAFGAPITAELTPAADLDRLMPLATSALELQRGALMLTDTTVTVHVPTTAALATPDVQAFTDLGAELGLEARAILTPLQMRGGVTASPEELAEQQTLIAGILAVPGGASVGVSSSDVRILTNDPAGLEAAAQLIAAAPEYAQALQLALSDDPESWIRMRSGGIPAERVSAVHTAALQARHELPGAERTITNLTPRQAKLTVFLSDEAAAEGETVATARERLRPWLADGTFDEITVSGRGISLEDEQLS